MHHARLIRNGAVQFAPVVCRSCSGIFTPARSNVMYCTQKCKVAAWKKANPERHKAHRERERVAATPPPQSKVFFNTCRVCSKAWTGQTSGLVCSAGCANTEARAAHSVRALAAHVKAAREVNCADCDCKFCPMFGSRDNECCQPCFTERNKAGKRVQRSKREAVLRRATVENVDPFKVFSRDGWRCQDCGVGTPRSKRGTCDDNAPELDHIKPLSKGGAHSYENTQCLCRRCNGIKSDTWVAETESI